MGASRKTGELLAMPNPLWSHCPGRETSQVPISRASSRHALPGLKWPSQSPLYA